MQEIGKYNFKGVIVMVAGNLYKKDPYGGSSYVQPFLDCSPSYLYFPTLPLSCLLSPGLLFTAASFPLPPSLLEDLCNHCHCYLAHGECAAVTPCVVTTAQITRLQMDDKIVGPCHLSFAMLIDVNWGVELCP